MNSLQFRHQILSEYQASALEIAELLVYNQNQFHLQNLKSLTEFPLEDEPHIVAWEQYETEGNSQGNFVVLKSHLVQFQFPIQAGISQSQEYRAAIRQGQSTQHMTSATGLELTQPNDLELEIYRGLGGAIPVLIAPNRQDFITLVQALTKGNEPVLIPESMGACIIGGYNNWSRVNQYYQNWQQNHPNSTAQDWQVEFQRLIPRKELYQDRLIILSRGPYSSVAGKLLGLAQKEWEEISLKIRLEHEYTHYLTRRLFGSMQNNLLDELIADYRGIVAGLGFYRADWFLHFLGLESFPIYRPGGRLENYRGSLSQGGFEILQKLVVQAANNLEEFTQKYPQEEIPILMTLASLTLEELASDLSEDLLLAGISKFGSI